MEAAKRQGMPGVPEASDKRIAAMKDYQMQPFDTSYERSAPDAAFAHRAVHKAPQDIHTYNPLMVITEMKTERIEFHSDLCSKVSMYMFSTSSKTRTGRVKRDEHSFESSDQTVGQAIKMDIVKRHNGTLLVVQSAEAKIMKRSALPDYDEEK